MLKRLACLAALVLSACATPPGGALPIAPPSSSAASSGMVTAANPLAVEAGLQVLRRGGTAADAAVALQGVLGLVEPQSSGLGGGAFITYYDARTRRVTAYSGRETAPRGATPDMFLDADGKPLPFILAARSGRSTGVPGAVAALALVQKAHGALPWRDLWGEAARLADEGFAVSPRLSGYVNGPMMAPEAPDLVAYFSKPDGSLVKTGDVLRNPAYAQTVRRIAAEGPAALYEGPLAEAMAARARAEPRAGTLTSADIAAYRPAQSDALCRPYRIYVVCAPPPPSGGIGVLLGLAILERTDIDRRGPEDPQAWSLFVQASRLMYADRDRYVGDPDFISVPVEGLLDPAYVAARAALIGDRAGPPPGPGTPAGAGVRAPDRTLEPAGTSHVVVVDRWGNVLSMTTTVESVFGSGRMVGGFVLNNQLTDFSFQPEEPDGAPSANAVAPLKRPRSSMAPTIVLDRQGRFVAAVGSPGGSSIIAYNLKTLVAVLDWGLPMQTAIDLPNIIARGGAVFGERDKLSPAVLRGLAERGIDVQSGRGEESGIHGVLARGGRLEGGADPRREGVALAP
jgi:gamma-glutamyltranspeptidase / glutathione hydrolase